MPKGGRTVSESALTCVICCNETDFYCIGDCNHPVCCECGIRMRVICQEKVCPICRHEMNKLYMVSIGSIREFTIKDTRSYKRDPKLDAQYGMVFENDEAINALRDLLAHVCTVCNPEKEFKSFVELERHMKRDHTQFYCDLCVNNLKLYSWERKCYSRKDLATHRRMGDNDDRSHRGHPNCQFCEVRYLDNDALFLHLRRDHFFCHFCDADGISSQFYDSYAKLAEHFDDEHYLCQEGDCLNEQFTHAFRTEMEFKLHQPLNVCLQCQASHKKTRGERVVDVEWGTVPRPGNQMSNGFSSQRNNRGGRGGERGGDDGGGRGGGGGGGGGAERRRPMPYHRRMEMERAQQQQGDQPDEYVVVNGNSKINTVIKISNKSRPNDNGGGENSRDSAGVSGGPSSINASAGAKNQRKGGKEFKNEAEEFPNLRDGDVSTSDGFRNFAGWSGRNQPQNLGADNFPSLRETGGDGSTSSASTSQPSSVQNVHKTQNNNNSNKKKATTQPKNDENAQCAEGVGGGSRKKPNRGIVVIDDDEDFPSLAKQSASKPPSATSASSHKKTEAEKKPLRHAPEPIQPLNHLPTQQQHSGGSSSLYERLTSSKWSTPKNLSQATACLENEFPSLAPQNAPQNPTGGGKSMWSKKAKANAGKVPVEKLADSHAAGRDLEGFDWLKNPTKKPTKTDERKADANAKKAGIIEFTKVGQTKAKARRVAQLKQKPVLAKDEDDRDASPLRKSPSPDLSPPPSTTDRPVSPQPFQTVTQSSKKSTSGAANSQKSKSGKLTASDQYPPNNDDFDMSISSSSFTKTKAKMNSNKDQILPPPGLSSLGQSAAREDPFPSLSAARVGGGPPGLQTPPGLSKNDRNPDWKSSSKTNNNNKRMTSNQSSSSAAPPPPGLSLSGIYLRDKPIGKENATYVRPRDFDKRNKSLFQSIWTTMGSQDLDEFKSKSKEFRNGELDGVDYSELIRKLMGYPLYKKVLPELISLLPDISRQQTLLNATEAVLSSTNDSSKLAWGSGGKGSGGAKGSGKDGDGRSVGTLWVCNKCDQCCQQWDKSDHLSTHVASFDFPAL